MVHPAASQEGVSGRLDMIVSGMAVEVSGSFLKTARLSEEWYEDLEDPQAFVAQMKRSGIKADLFTFWQRLPRTEPRHGYATEPETIAVLPVTTYEHWYKSQINNKTRNLLVKAGKKGVVVREAVFDDAFVEGITAIFNETPIRQERRFAHYGKSVATVRREFSRFLFRETLLGAYIGDELVGFIMLADAGRYATLTQIISLVRHRDKSPNNALIAKAVEVCAERQVEATRVRAVAPWTAARVQTPQRLRARGAPAVLRAVDLQRPPRPRPEAPPGTVRAATRGDDHVLEGPPVKVLRVPIQERICRAQQEARVTRAVELMAMTGDQGVVRSLHDAGPVREAREERGARPFAACD